MNDVTQPARRRRMPPVVAAIVSLVALLAFAPLASAASDPLAGGTTTITLNKGLVNKLSKNGVKVLKASPATVKGRTVTLPVSGGALDPTNGQGTVEHSGGIKFKRGKKTAAVNTLVLDTTTSSLNAKVAGKTMKLASVAKVALTRNGFGANVSIGQLKLTGKAAKQLNKKLNITTKGKKGKGKANKLASASKGKAANNLFKGNQNLGSAASETQPKTVAVLPVNLVALTGDLGTLGKFAELKASPELVPPAQIVGGPLPPVFGFPISGGTIAPDAISGVLQSAGGFKIVKKVEPAPGVEFEIRMLLTNIWLDLAAKTATAEVTIESSNPALFKAPGNLGRSSIADVSLTGATVVSNATARTVSVTGATASLQPVTAEVLNEVFANKEQKFKAGDPLGAFSFTAQTQ